MKIRIGHGVYSGANKLFVCSNKHRAVLELIDRGVNKPVARKKVEEACAYPYPHTTMTTKNYFEVIEIVCILD
jgi:hypothetical protein